MLGPTPLFAQPRFVNRCAVKATHFCPKGSLSALRRDLLALMIGRPGVCKKPRLALSEKQASLVDAVEVCLASHTKADNCMAADGSIENIAAADVGACMLARRASSIRKTFNAPTLEGIVAQLKKFVEPDVVLLVAQLPKQCSTVPTWEQFFVVACTYLHAGFQFLKCLEVRTTALRPQRRWHGQLKLLTCWRGS